MILSTTGKLTDAVLGSANCPKGFPPDLFRTAKRKLAMIVAAKIIEDLATPPGNHLEALKADRTGQHSIRINDKWRICFRWTEAGAEDVEIVDYH